jgi:hypothetical protein
MQGIKIRSEVRSEIAEVKTEGSDLCNGYNGLVPDVKPFRLTESVKAAG